MSSRYEQLPLGAYRADLRTCATPCSSCHNVIRTLADGVEARDARIAELEASCHDLGIENIALAVKLRNRQDIVDAAREVLRHWPNDDGGLWTALDALKRVTHTPDNENSQT